MLLMSAYLSCQKKLRVKNLKLRILLEQLFKELKK